MKNFKASFHLAMANLCANPMRSLLTMTGVTIGTACVIVIGAILNGMDQSVVQEMQGFGADTFFAGRLDPGIRLTRPSPEEEKRKIVTWEDFERIRQTCTACSMVSVVIRGRRGDKVRYKTKEFRGARMECGLPDFPEVTNLPIGAGRCFTMSENNHRVAVCIVGADVVKGLFPGESPLGKVLTVDGYPMRIVGVLAPKRAAGPFVDLSKNGSIVLPYLTFRKLYPSSRDHNIIAKACPGQLFRAVDQVRSSLRISRRIRPGRPDTFIIRVATAIVRQFRDLTGTIALVAYALSFIGLMVGGVGVMNIMLVSVTERTREIGVRKALGGRKRDILLQFLLESATLTGCGGLAGVATGCAVSLAVESWVDGLPASFSAGYIALGLGFSVVVGIVFGLWPAWRAACLSPVDALRHE